MNKKNKRKRTTVNLINTAHFHLKKRSEATGIKLEALLDDAVFEYLKQSARIPRLAENEE